MKKFISTLLVVTVAVFCIACIGKINELERQYDENVENLTTTYESQIESITNKYEQLKDTHVELENQVYNCMTGESYEIRVEHDDEIHYWTCTDNKGLFTNKSHIICYQ